MEIHSRTRLNLKAVQQEIGILRPFRHLASPISDSKLLKQGILRKWKIRKLKKISDWECCMDWLLKLNLNKCLLSKLSASAILTCAANESVIFPFKQRSKFLDSWSRCLVILACFSYGKLASTHGLHSTKLLLCYVLHVSSGLQKVFLNTNFSATSHNFQINKD